jgi:hypothetical protein
MDGFPVRTGSSHSPRPFPLGTIAQPIRLLEFDSPYGGWRSSQRIAHGWRLNFLCSLAGAPIDLLRVSGLTLASTTGALTMNRRTAAICRFAMAGFATTTLAPIAIAEEETPFKQTNIHFETNATACDMGIQISFDTDGITRAEVENPFGQAVFRVNAVDGMEITSDISEVFHERVEPPIDELVAALGCEPGADSISLGELFAAWPAGWYEFDGESQGEEFEGKARLTHRIPAGPKIITPTDGAIVPHDRHLGIRWKPVTAPILPQLGPIRVAGYHVLVVDITNPVLAPGQTKTSFDADVSSAETTFFVPAQYLEPNKIYELEVLATEGNGNQTITEGGVFCTPPITASECVKP